MADNNNGNKSNSGDAASERPQDWEMLSLSLSSIADPKPSTDAGPNDAYVDAVPSSTGSGDEEPKGISDDQVHSKYFGLASPSLSDKTRNEEGIMFEQEAGGKETYVGDYGTASVKDGLEGIGVSSDVDWLEPSPVLASPISSGEIGATEAVSTELESFVSKNEKEQQHSISSKATAGYSSAVGSSPIVEGPDTVSELYSCLSNDEAERFTDIGTEILAEPDYPFSETFDEVYEKPRAADVDSSEKPLLGSSSESKSKKTWWKQQVEVLGVHVSQASALWSLALAATVMGLVILGQRWHHERSQNQQLRLQLGSKDEKINQLIFQISRLKDAVYGRRRVPVMRS